MEKENSYVRMWESLKSYGSLRLELLKLTAAEKLTMILGLLAMGLVCVLLGSVLLFFVSLSIVQFIAPYVGFGWAYLIMALLMLVVIVVVLLLRRSLILNPLARFISRVLLK